MAEIVAGMASSHAYAFVPPEQWEQRREVSRQRWVKRFGAPPAVQPELEQETLEGNLRRYGRIRGGLDRLRSALASLNPDALILIGDDQNENYRDHVPQLAVYVGERFVAVEPERGGTSEHRTDVALAKRILAETVDAGFDVASSKAFPEDKLISHAHAQILDFLKPTMPVVLLFVNAIHVPAPTPMRCYQFGERLRKIIESLPDGRKIALYASGGLSHFTGTYPWDFYSGSYSMGSISQQFDRKAVELIVAGRGAELAHLSSRDLLDNGDIEMRQWITLLGALDGRRPEWVVYEPFYRAIMGIAVGYWQLN